MKYSRPSRFLRLLGRIRVSAAPNYWLEQASEVAGTGPRPLHRLGVAAALAIICGVVSFTATRMPGFRDQDFASWWLAARAILDGRDPYTTVVSASGPGFVYPLPAALATIPFARLPATIAGPIWIGVSCGILAFAVTIRAWWPLLMFASAAMMLNVIAAQWSPILTAAAIVVPLTWIETLKPNIGLALFAARPRWSTIIAAVVIVGACFAIQPSWLTEWARVAEASRFHFAPVRTVGGPLLLAVLVRWRRPEARLLAVLVVVPSSPVIYETLPLFLVPQRRVEIIALAALSDVVYLLLTPYSLQHDAGAYLAVARPAIAWLMYLPAVAMTLIRPNVGRAPPIIESFARRAPAWIRGSPPHSIHCG